MLKVYLASKFALKQNVIALADVLKANNIAITCEWWLDDIKNIQVTDTEWYLLPQVVAIANRDFNCLIDADVIVLVSDENQSLSFNGANIEIGYALAFDKPVFILGKIDRNALYTRCTLCTNILHLIHLLKQLEEK